MEMLMYDVECQGLILMMRWMDILVINVALGPLFDVADVLAVDAIVNLYHHSSNDDVNADAFDDLMVFAFLQVFLAFDAADIYSPDVPSYEAL